MRFWIEGWLSGQRFAAIIALCCFTWAAAQIVKPGDAFYSFFWTRSATDEFNYGYFGLATADTIMPPESITVYPMQFRMFPGSWWRNIVSNINATLGITISNGATRPNMVIMCSKKFDNLQWLQSIGGSTFKGAYNL